MIRFLNTYFPLRTLLLGLSEACIVALAFVGGAIVRLGANNAGFMLGSQRGYLKILVVIAAFMTCMYYFDLYESTKLHDLREALSRFVQVLGTVCIALALLYYLYPALGLGRKMFAIGFSLGAVVLLLWRQLFLRVNVLPQFTERAVILGDSSIAESLTTELREHSEFGVRVVGHLKSFENVDNSQAASSREECFASVLDSVTAYDPHKVIVAFGERRGKLPVNELLQLRDRGVKIQDGIDLYEAMTGKVHVDTLRTSFLLFSLNSRSSRSQMCERTFSVFVSAVALVAFFPLMCVIAVAIRLDSEGVVIFRQRRIGQNGKLFTLYKFRTMIDRGDGNNDTRPPEKADPRFTRVGRFLRRTHLDELPQFLNILRGDMNCVGPRPFVPNQEEECVKCIPYYARRWSVRPGATGWAQINRGYNITIDDNKEKLAYDLYYIKNMSIGLDVLILFKTIKILLLGRGSR